MTKKRYTYEEAEKSAEKKNRTETNEMKPPNDAKQVIDCQSLAVTADVQATSANCCCCRSDGQMNKEPTETFSNERENY